MLRNSLENKTLCRCGGLKAVDPLPHEAFSGAFWNTGQVCRNQYPKSEDQQAGGIYLVYWRRSGCRNIIGTQACFFWLCACVISRKPLRNFLRKGGIQTFKAIVHIWHVWIVVQCWERGEVESMIKFQHEIGAQNQRSLICDSSAPKGHWIWPDQWLWNRRHFQQCTGGAYVKRLPITRVFRFYLRTMERDLMRPVPVVFLLLAWDGDRFNILNIC